MPSILSRLWLVTLVIAVLLGHAMPAVSQEVPDQIFVNGRIWTGDDERPRAEALAVHGDRLLAVGTNDEVRELAGPDTRIVDMKGRFVSPGFNDAHLHFLVVETLDLSESFAWEDMKRDIREFAEAHPRSIWIQGRGWSYSVFPGGLPHKELLDELVPDRPAWMTAYDGHTGWCNSKALEIAGITKETSDPENGEIVRDEQGEPTGVFKEAAQRLVRGKIPPPTEEERYQALKLRLTQAASYGLTSVQNAGFPEDDLPVYERVMKEGGLKVRFRFAVPFKKSPSEEEMANYRSLRDKYTGPLIKTGAAKGLLDGVVEAKTAAMFDPYPDGGTGELMWTEEELNRTVALYDREGYQVCLHSIGDKAVHVALNACEYAAKTNGTSDRRHRVEHIETLKSADIPRFKQLGVIASTQAIFARPDPNTLGFYSETLGPDRASRAMAFKLLDDAGAVQAFGSDWPVYPMVVLAGIHAAVTRTTAEGTPQGGWQPHLKISAEAALRHFTRDAAYASHDEKNQGTLTPGKLADFVVLSEDILTIPPQRILETKVLLTVMGGKETYRAEEF